MLIINTVKYCSEARFALLGQDRDSAREEDCMTQEDMMRVETAMTGMVRRMRRMGSSMNALSEPLLYAEYMVAEAILCYGEAHPTEQGMRVSALAEALCAPMPAVSRTLKGLEEKGIITRETDKKNRRNVILGLSEEGRALVCEIRKNMQDVWMRIIEQLGVERVLDMVSMFTSMADMMEAETEVRGC